MNPLQEEERESFRAYAEENRTELDGTQSQWADYTLRALAEIDRLTARVGELESETTRLSGCLAVANANHERFERDYYLQMDRADAAEGNHDAPR